MLIEIRTFKEYQRIANRKAAYIETDEEIMELRYNKYQIKVAQRWKLVGEEIKRLRNLLTH
jgi:hypothetical protein